MNYLQEKPEAVLDIETYRDYFLVMLRDVATLKTATLEMYEGHPLDVERLGRLLRRFRIVTFNGNNYDVPMLALAMSGATNIELKRASDGIILADVKPWEFYELHGIERLGYLDHIDLIEVAPGQAGLKIYGGRLHSKRMQDLPIDPDASITPDLREPMRLYCGNDLFTTIDLRHELRKQIELRCIMSNEYGIDLRSKSDAQIAEAVIKAEVERVTGRRVRKPDLEKPGRFFYVPPKFIRFQTPVMRDLLDKVRSFPLVIERNGRVQKTDEFKQLRVTIGTTTYQLGIGGLHSQESCRSLYTDDDYVLIDRDVASYYPALIINNHLIPSALGQRFLEIYKSIRTRRLAAKVGGNKEVAETLKIVLNGTFGKLGQPFSIVYAPRQMINVTLTGQLSLLMAIERLEMNGISVVSANTDGFVSRVPRDKIDLFEAIMFDWECDTDFETEEVRYRSLHSRDINNYIAIDQNGKVKLKGEYAASGPGLPAAMGLKKNPAADIATDAVVEYLKNGTPIEETIRGCYDIRRFVSIQQVRGGAVCEPEGYLGKAVRWYYAVGRKGAIHYKLSGNRVSRTEGAKPLMELPDEFPDDIDYAWYEREAYGILKDIGVRFVDPAYVGRRGQSLGRLPDKKNLHIVDLSNGVALCGARTPGPRVRWVEYDEMPAGHRLCAKCRREDEL